MKFRGFVSTSTGIQIRHWTIVPSEDVLDPRPFSLYVVSDGILVMEDEGGHVESYPVIAGHIMPFSPVRILPASTAGVIGWRGA